MDRDEEAIGSALAALYGQLPEWIPLPTVDRAKRIIQKLLNDRFGLNDIKRLVGEEENDKLSFPGIVRDPAAFAHSVNELAHLRYAISLGKHEGLLCLAGEQAKHGQAFKDGRKRGTAGPIRKKVARLLKANETMKNPELWAAITNKPPRGWKLIVDSQEKKYLEGPTVKDHMTQGRFFNVCGQERKKTQR